MKNEQKKCWACHRTLVGKPKFGLCQDCLNKGGTVLASIALAAAAVTAPAAKKFVKDVINNIKT